MHDPKKNTKKIYTFLHARMLFLTDPHFLAHVMSLFLSRARVRTLSISVFVSLPI